MTQEQGAILIEKFINHTLTTKEARDLICWLEADQAHVDYFLDCIEVEDLLAEQTHHFNTATALNKVKALLVEENENTFAWKSVWKYAAIFIGIVVLLGGGYYFFTAQSNISTKKQWEYTQNQVVLRLGNGSTQEIGQKDTTIKNSAGQIIGLTQNNALTYAEKSTASKLVYNELWVPYGKRFELVLSDGTKVYLNAGTKLKYPAHFLPHQKRGVFLDGEAYFDVATDSSRQFVVSSKNQEVKVYGTQFNIAAYPEDSLIKTVLVEGSVGIFCGSEQARLKPGQLGVTRQESTAIKVTKVNPARYTAWMQNGLIFSQLSFSKVVKILERRYAVQIINHDKGLAQQKFTANFKDQSLEDIIKLLAKIYPFKYSINENIVTLTPK